VTFIKDMSDSRDVNRWVNRTWSRLLCSSFETADSRDNASGFLQSLVSTGVSRDRQYICY